MSTYTKTYSNMRGVDLSSERSECDARRFNLLLNMWRDYHSNLGAAVETAPGFRKLANVVVPDGYDKKINGIHYLPGDTPYLLVHVGTRMEAYPITETEVDGEETDGEETEGEETENKKTVLSLGDPKNVAYTWNDAKSSSVYHYGKLYIVDGANYRSLKNNGSIITVDAVSSTPYIPTTFENGVAYEQRNMLTDYFVQKNTATGVGGMLDDIVIKDPCVAIQKFKINDTEKYLFQFVKHTEMVDRGTADSIRNYALYKYNSKTEVLTTFDNYAYIEAWWLNEQFNDPAVLEDENDGYMLVNPVMRLGTLSYDLVTGDKIETKRIEVKYVEHKYNNGALSMGAQNPNELTDGAPTPTIAKGINSIAVGRGTRANSQESAAFGLGTIASSDRQFVRGQYNLEDKDGKYVDIVGWGYEKGGGAVGRANIYTLTRKGEGWFQGDVYVGGSNMNWKASKLAKEDDVNNALNSFHGLKGEEKFTDDLPTEIYYKPIDVSYYHEVIEDDGSPDGAKTLDYNFENLIFTTNPDGAFRFNTLYTYLDTWSNRCYTINQYYHPNLKSGESVVPLTESFDPEGMLKSIALEAKFRGEGTYTHGNKDFALLAGADVVADGNGAASIGKENFVVGANANGFGAKGFVRAQTGTAMGYNNTVTGRHSVAFNEGNNVTGYASVGCGDHNNVFAAHSFGCGWQNKTIGQYNFLVGSETYSNGDHIFAFGHKGNYVGSSHIVNGNQNEVNGNYDIADGYKNAIFGDNNNVNGLNNAVGTVLRDADGNIIAKMPSSFNTVVGMKNKIVRETTEDETEEERNKRQSYGHIINGVENVIDATPSFRNIVNGQGNEVTSTVDDVGNAYVASGYSIISGIYNKVFSRFGSAIGEGLKVLGRSIVQLVIGKYNAPDPDASFIIGSGKSDSDRSNSFVIKKDGRAVLGAAPIDNMDAATKKYVDDKVSGIKIPSGGSAPSLYEHTVTILSNGGEDFMATATFITTDSASINSYDKALAFFKQNGFKAASGYSKDGQIVLSKIGYAEADKTAGTEEGIKAYGVRKTLADNSMTVPGWLIITKDLSQSRYYEYSDNVRTIF